MKALKEGFSPREIKGGYRGEGGIDKCKLCRIRHGSKETGKYRGERDEGAQLSLFHGGRQTGTPLTSR